MKCTTTVTSKGTVTIAAPLRKALRIKPGQKVTMDLTTDNRLVLETGTNLEQFAKLRASITKKIPDHLKGLSGSTLHQASAAAWAKGYYD